VKSRAARLVARTAAVLVLLGAVPAWMTVEGIPATRLLRGWFWQNVGESLRTSGAAALAWVRSTGPGWIMPAAAAFIGVSLAAIVAFILRRRARRTETTRETPAPVRSARRVGIASHLAARGEPALAIARQTGFARDAVRSLSFGDPRD
jgi:hypothetical protein